MFVTLRRSPILKKFSCKDKGLKHHKTAPSKNERKERYRAQVAAEGVCEDANSR